MNSTRETLKGWLTGNDHIRDSGVNGDLIVAKAKGRYGNTGQTKND